MSDNKGLLELESPCVFCGYSGEKYWQKEAHAKDCPFYKIGGVTDRMKVLRVIVSNLYKQQKQVAEQIFREIEDLLDVHDDTYVRISNHIPFESWTKLKERYEIK